MRLRILVADDSSLARSLLREILESDPDIEVVGEARDGVEAVAMARSLGPDLVTMDLRMPVLDGIGAITEIMATRPLPILVVSSAADAETAYLAVQRGALETLAKPDFTERARAELVARVKSLAGARVLTHLRPGQLAKGGAGGREGARAVPGEGPLIALAASTGGPQALARILSALPADFPSPLLVAQHISDGFAPGLVQWLSGICRLPVRLARGGETPKAGEVYLSPSERNLCVRPGPRLGLLEPAEGQIFHPLCDLLFSSLAEVCGRRSVGVILTGMSEDGVRGLESVRAGGGVTIAQDEASSVVFGMNRLAIERGAASRVLSLEEIPPALCLLAAGGGL